MFCPRCGAENPAGAKFCIHDGTALGVTEQPKPRGGPLPSGGLGRSPTARRWLVPIVALIVLVALGVTAFNGYGMWQRGQRETAYQRGVAAASARNYEEAIADFQAAGDYQDAPTRLADSQKNLAGVLPPYQRAVAAQSEGRALEAALALRDVQAVQPGYKDVGQRLAQLRAALGRILYVVLPASGSQSAIWSISPDGGDRREVVGTGAQASSSSSPDVWRVGPSRLAVRSSGSSDALYLADLDGSNRTEVFSQQNIKVLHAGEQSRMLVVSGTDANSTTTIVAIDPRSGAKRDLFSVSRSEQGGWHGASVDGSRVLVSRVLYPAGVPRSGSTPSGFSASGSPAKLGDRILNTGISYSAPSAPAPTARPAASPVAKPTTAPARPTIAPAKPTTAPAASPGVRASPVPTLAPTATLLPRQRQFIVVDTATGQRTDLAPIDEAPLRIQGQQGQEVSETGNPSEGTLSPDGQSAALVTGSGQRPPTVHASIVHIDQGQTIDLTDAQTAYGQFSADSRLFLLTLRESGSFDSSLLLVDAQTGGRVELLHDALPLDWVHGGGGRKLFVVAAPSGQSDRQVLYEFDENGSGRTEVLSGQMVKLSPSIVGGGYVHALVWERDRSAAQSILLKTDGSGRIDLAAGEPYYGFLTPSFSPDLSRVALAARDASRGRSEQARLLVYDLRQPGAPPVQLASAAVIFGPDWSPDGQSVYYSASTTPLQEFSSSSSGTPAISLYVVVAGQPAKPTQLTSDGSVMPLAWLSAPK
jgi:hypothetical protein